MDNVLLLVITVASAHICLLCCAINVFITVVCPACSHPSLFAGSYSVVAQICGITSRIKIHNLDPSVDRSIRIAWQFKQVFKPYHMMLKELNETKKQQFLSECCCKEKKNVKKYQF
jgi:hypothetical protein